MFLKNDNDNQSSIYIMVILLIICLFFLYENTFNKKNLNKIRSLPQQFNRDKEQHFTNMPLCIDIIDPLEQNMLIDYYIASSYNTPLIGNQKNDYLSLQMIGKVIDAGARYIELEICKSNISDGAPPVVAMGQKVGNWIISSNSLQISDVFNLIARKAFTLKSGKVNYPLIIYLKINTDDIITLNNLAFNIKESCQNLLLENTPYLTKPVFLEKMCKLLNKIIILADENYQENNLVDIVLPTNNLINYFKYDEIDSVNAIPEKGDKSKSYNDILSSEKQEKDNQYFIEKYPTTLSKDFEVGSDLLEKFKKDKNIVDPLTQFNKVGLTVVSPHKKEDVFSLNYPYDNYFLYGCQCVAMNYQVLDEHLADYLKFFNKSSFVLKPAGLRFHRRRKDVDDLSSMFPYKEKPSVQAKSEFLKDFDNKLVSIESLHLPGYFLTITGLKAAFEMGKYDGNNELLPPPDKQMFIINRSRYKKTANGLEIRPLTNSQQVLTTDGTYFNFKKVGNSSASIRDSTLFPIESLCQRKDYISFATVPTNTINVMAIQKYSLKEYKKTKENKLAIMSCFKFREIDHEKYIVFKHLPSGKYIKTLPKGEVVLSGTKVTSDHKFLVSGNFRGVDEETGELKKVTLGTQKNTFLGKTDIHMIDSRDNSISSNTLMYISFDGTAWNIINQDRFLSSSDGKTLSFEFDKPELTPEKRDKKDKIIQVAVYGPSLDNNKRFQIQEFFEPK
tara:strand:+ start:240 stop:2426 length:2187 start_codon:yes stop_codon:yes gene_type:complete